MIPFFLLIPALVLLAAYGAWCVVTGAFSPWHWLVIGAEFGGLVLLVRLGWVWIGNLRKAPKS